MYAYCYSSKYISDQHDTHAHMYIELTSGMFTACPFGCVGKRNRSSEDFVFQCMPKWDPEAKSSYTSFCGLPSQEPQSPYVEPKYEPLHAGMYVWICTCGNVRVEMYVWICLCIHPLSFGHEKTPTSCKEILPANTCTRAHMHKYAHICIYIRTRQLQLKVDAVFVDFSVGEGSQQQHCAVSRDEFRRTIVLSHIDSCACVHVCVCVCVY